jgi:hypothetical protein
MFIIKHACPARVVSFFNFDNLVLEGHQPVISISGDFPSPEGVKMFLGYLFIGQ